VLIFKLTGVRNIDDEPRIYGYTKSALLIYIQYPSRVAVAIKNTLRHSYGGDVKLFLCKVREVA
jgi:hypothetical protein